MLRVGVTGGIGSGKSLVCRILSVLGVPVFHADLEGRRLLAEDPATRRAVIEAFGAEVAPAGTIDRKLLAERVFHHPEALARLNGIIHPAVRTAFTEWAARQSAPYVVMEAALLVDTGGADTMDHLVVVTAPEELRLRRVMERDGVDEADVRARMRNQVGEEERTAAADSILVNDEVRMLLPQVLQVHQRLLEQARS